MKNTNNTIKTNKLNHFKKLIAVIAAVSVLALVFAIMPSAAAEEIKLKDFKGNDVVRTLVNTITGILAVSGIIVGGVQIFSGIIGQDPKQRNTGIVTIITSLTVGGVILTVINMILA